MAKAYWNSYTIPFPCKDCTDRKLGCNKDCDRYKEAKKRQDDYNKKIADTKKIEVDLYRARFKGKREF